MKLMTKTLEKRFKQLGSQKDKPYNKIKLPVKFTHPINDWEWYPIEYSPKDKVFLCLFCGENKEIGYVSLAELESIKVFGGHMGIERSLYYKEMTLEEALK